MRRFLKVAEAGGTLVYWTGLPIMRDQAYAGRVKAANDAAETACGEFAGCRYIDAWSMFADENGAYARKLKTGDKERTMRAKDGVHLTMTGYDYLCRRILAQVARQVDLRPKQ